MPVLVLDSQDFGRSTVFRFGPSEVLVGASVDREELRRLVFSYLGRHGLGGPTALKEVYFHARPALNGQHRLLYLQFAQTVEDLLIEGARVHMTLIEADGRFTVASSRSKLYENVELAPPTTLSDDALQSKAAEVLGLSGNRAAHRSMERFVAEVEGRLRRVREYVFEPALDSALVDEDTGEAWRLNRRLEVPGVITHASDLRRPGVFGTVQGLGILFDPLSPVLATMLMAHQPVTAQSPSGPLNSVTNLLGQFGFPGILVPVPLSATLGGTYSVLIDPTTPVLSAGQVGVPGVENSLFFNDANPIEQTTAQVTAYYHTTLVHDWIQNRMPVPLPGLDIPIATHVNDTAGPVTACNAYYQQSDKSLHFVSSVNYGIYQCVNSAFDTVVSHEYGHFADHVAGGIVDKGVSEGFGDIMAVFASGQPLTGENFFGPGSFIRTADNDYAYPWDGMDEVHNLGQSWAGFAWHARDGFMGKYGPLLGAAAADALFVPLLNANSINIPTAVWDAIIADDDNQTLADLTPNFPELEAAARRHNLSPFRDGSVALITGPKGSNFTSSQTSSVTVTGVADTAPLAALGLQFRDYQLFVGSGINPADYTPLGPPVTSPVSTAGTLGTWNLAGLPTGTHMLQVRVTATNGMEFQGLAWNGVEAKPFVQVSPNQPGGYYASSMAGDGQRIVWTGMSDNQIHTCIHDPSVGACVNEQVLTSGQGQPKQNPRVSGNLIVWEEGPSVPYGGPHDIYAYHLGTGQLYPIATDPSADEAEPDVSGHAIVWADVIFSTGPGGSPLISATVLTCNLNPGTGSCPPQIVATSSATQFILPPARISQNLVSWGSYSGPSRALHVHNLSTQTTFTITAPAAVPFLRSLSGKTVLWQDYRANHVQPLGPWPFGHPFAQADLYGCVYDPASGTCPEVPIVVHPADQSRASLTGNLLAWIDGRNVSGFSSTWFGVYPNNPDVYTCTLHPATLDCGPQQVTAHPGSVGEVASTGKNIVWQDLRAGGPFFYLEAP
ncbi:MAG: hypothetical protein HYY13_01930 [Nitrospirae bacterium]|nr:hypothetical protein [Nitrospirota bacterium]